MLLIHGYGIGRTAPILYRRFDRDGGFTVFEDLVKKKLADVFYWDIEKNYSLLQILNPLESFNLYTSEKKKASTQDVLKKLNKKLMKDQPETIICHSLGSQLLLNYVNKYGIPIFIKKIVFIQGDVSPGSITNKITYQKLFRNRKMKILNIYCPWDYTLWSSAIINWNFPIGLRKIRKKEITNILLPVSFFDAHINGIRKSRQILRLIDDN